MLHARRVWLAFWRPEEHSLDFSLLSCPVFGVGVSTTLGKSLKKVEQGGEHQLNWGKRGIKRN